MFAGDDIDEALQRFHKRGAKGWEQDTIKGYTEIFPLPTKWCPGPESNRYVPFGTRDFKSRASASFATRAGMDSTAFYRSDAAGHL
jgi:hypothetical protein